MDPRYIRSFDTLSQRDLAIAGGKNAALGEMISNLKKQGIKIPDGFATTAYSYWEYIHYNKLKEPIFSLLKDYKNNKISLSQAGSQIRQKIKRGKFPPSLKKAIIEAYQNLSNKYHQTNADVAVRSSATAEDLPTASFAGQQDSFLNIHGEKDLIEACKKCYASLFTNRAIVYREEHGFDHAKVALSIGIQKMVRSDLACSGVIFSLDPESGFRNVIVINAGWGLGENIVQGIINPDEFVLFKPSLSKKKISPILEKTLGQKEKMVVYSKGKKSTKNLQTPIKLREKFTLSNEEIIHLGHWTSLIENYYQHPMDIEWAKDGLSQELFILQARPETVKSQIRATEFKTYSLKEKKNPILQGIAIGEAITTGKVQVIKTVKEMKKFKKDSILVTQTTSPDWVPIMKIAKGIITDHGGRTSHAAIVSRELGIPGIVGTNRGTHILKNNQEITLSCSEGEIGSIYEGKLPYTEEEISLEKLPSIPITLMINISSPAAAFRWWPLPCKGIGLARMEFIITNMIKIHPMALVHFNKLQDKKDKKRIELLTKRYASKTEYFIDTLSSSIAKIAASQYPNPVIVRMSDFKTNEYADLIGGKQFEPHEENPMLGFRGASRYYNERYKAGFLLECEAIKRSREFLGFTNILIMIPFCRTPEEADRVLEVLSENGLKRGEKDLQIYMMCEIPSNVILADAFAKRFDGFSIGSNDLTQLILGIDRDSEELAPLFDARNEAVKKMIHEVIQIAHQNHCKVGICGQAPSDYPEFAQFLMREGIDSISLNPDSVIPILRTLAKTKKLL